MAGAIVPLFMHSAVWLVANTNIKVHELHSLIKRVSASRGKETNVTNTL